MPISLEQALDLTRTGDVWLFRGRTMADRAIQVSTNSPVNHVGMSVVIEDMPALMWHAELGRSLPDLWAGTRQRGVQLHDLRAAVRLWGGRYGQRAWLRQLEPTATADMEDAVLRTIARLDGIPFPSSAQLGWRWLNGRVPQLPWIAGSPWLARLRGEPAESRPRSAEARPDEAQSPASLETAYCAEVVALTYEAMGLLAAKRRTSWYDPGRFWSGDDLALTRPRRLGQEIAIDLDE
jgi:hypothetical protein